ncbi:MAG: hypothetical protein ACRDPM_13915 [Solirubrobacteraceae bacterium]
MNWVLLAVIIVLLAIIGILVARQQRSRRLKDDFGPEYSRTVAQHGDQRVAEQELTSRRRRLSQFEIRPLEPPARERYLDRWGATQRHFVDEPVEAVGQAHVLVQEVMRDRGYPVDQDFEQRAADLSVEHPDLVENYRRANEISIRARSGQASTEQLRQSMVHFRALFDDLLAPGDTADDDGGIRGDAAHAGDGDQSEVAQRATPRG